MYCWISLIKYFNFTILSHGIETEVVLEIDLMMVSEDVGCYDRLEAMVPKYPNPSWMCNVTKWMQKLQHIRIFKFSHLPWTLSYIGIQSRTGIQSHPLKLLLWEVFACRVRPREWLRETAETDDRCCTPVVYKNNIIKEYIKRIYDSNQACLEWCSHNARQLLTFSGTRW
jgi:hypothetical protein